MQSTATLTTTLSPEDQLELQRAKVGFWMHFAAFALVNAFIIALNFAYTPTVIWFIFVLFPWGAGLAVHGVAAFYLTPIKLREKELRASRSGPPSPALTPAR